MAVVNLNGIRTDLRSSGNSPKEIITLQDFKKLAGGDNAFEDYEI